MDTLRIKRSKGYTVLPNAVLRDDRLNLQTKGLYCLMMSLPDDWSFSAAGLAKVAGCSRDRVSAILKALEATGYMLREQKKSDNGQFLGNTYVLYDEAQPIVETPKKEPLPGFPATGKPSTEKPSPEKSAQLNKDKPSKDKKTPIVPKEVVERITEYANGDCELVSAIGGLLANRIALKKPVLTVRAMDGILRKLDKLSGGDRKLKFDLLDEATQRNWLTLFPLRRTEESTGGGRVQQQEGDYEV